MHNLARAEKYTKRISDLLPQPAFKDSKCSDCKRVDCGQCSKCPIKDIQLRIDSSEVKNIKISHKTIVEDADYITKFIIGADLNEVVFSATPAQSKNEKDVMLIDFKSKRETDTNDTLFVHKSKFATRNLTLHVDYNPDEMDVTPAGFCFMDKDMIGNRMKIDYFPRSLKIRFKNWILPGNGVMFNITPKK